MFYTLGDVPRIAHTSAVEQPRNDEGLPCNVRPLSVSSGMSQAEIERDQAGATAAAATPPSVDPRPISAVQVAPSEIEIPSAAVVLDAPVVVVASKPPRTRVGRDDIPRIDQFCLDAEYLGLAYSTAQLTLLKAIYGLALTPEERDVYGACTGRTRYREGHAASEVTVIAGARSGKDSRIAAPIALYEALFGDFPSARGEPIVVPLVAQDGDGSEIAFGYIRDYAMERPRLAKYVDNELSRELWITNARGVKLRTKCFACSAKSIRGWSIPAAVMDEVAFFRVEGGASADVRVQTAIRRGGLAFPYQRLVKITTPYLRAGVVYDDLKRYWGVDDPDVLVWKAPTALMNPAISTARIERERRKDQAAARVEYDAEFAEDVTTFLPAELLELAVVDGRHELAPAPGVRYQAAADPMGGGPDAFTLAIVHVDLRDGRPVMVQDLMRSWRSPRGEKLDLDQVLDEQAAVLARYGLFRLIGDRYAGEWPVQAYRKRSVLYEPAAHDKSAAYIEFEPWMKTGSIELLDHVDLVHEAGLLEKRLKPGGKKPTIDHPKGSHDDHPNAVALAVAALAGSLHPVATVSSAQLDREAPATPPDSPAALERRWRAHPAPDGAFWRGGPRARFAR
jgi:hypothetical protein